MKFKAVMMEHTEILRHIFSTANKSFIETIGAKATIIEVADKTTLLKEVQFVHAIPIVIEGLVRVYTQVEEKELLLYYIQPGEVCIMSFSAALKHHPSKIHAVTEGSGKLLMLPANLLNEWLKAFPEFSTLFFNQYNERYSALLETIQQLLFNKMDQRILEFLHKKMQLLQINPIPISHKQIARELGTAREVVSRILKKLEIEGKILQNNHTIKILR